MTLRQRQGGGGLSSLSCSGRSNREEAEKALILLRGRLSSHSFIFKPLCDDCPDSNYSKLKFLISSSIKEGCNNSLLLLGPRGCGKAAVLAIVLEDLFLEYPDTMTVIRLNGLLHGEDVAALKEIARQLCIDHQLSFSKMASFDDNSQFLIAMLRESGLAHKTITFVLDEFDLFTQGKQRLLYDLLDAVQSVTSQAVVIGVSCRLDADQLLEKRVRSRFSHRKLLFLPPSEPEVQRLINHILSLPMDSSILLDYATEFNTKLQDIFSDESFKEIIQTFLGCFPTVMHLKTFLYQAISSMDLDLGYLTLKNFNSSISCFQRQPKMQALKDCSILELYILVCMKRLEVKEQNSYSFNAVMRGESRPVFILPSEVKDSSCSLVAVYLSELLVINKCMNMSEYKSIHDSFQMSDFYSQQLCIRAFEHLLQRGLISFIDCKGHSQSIDFRQVKFLVSSAELSHGLKSYNSCPALLHKLAS